MAEMTRAMKKGNNPVQLAPEVALYWSELLAEEDRILRNNNRRHASHRADMDTTVVDRDIEPEECYPTKDLLALSSFPDFLEMIFSKDYHDIHQLVEDPDVSDALRQLTDKQKEVLFLSVVHRNPTRSIARYLGTSERNIRKHLEKALASVRAYLDSRTGWMRLLQLMWMVVLLGAAAWMIAALCRWLGVPFPEPLLPYWFR